MKRYLTIPLTLVLAFSLWTGCKSTLQPGGAYAPAAFSTNIVETYQSNLVSVVTGNVTNLSWLVQTNYVPVVFTNQTVAPDMGFYLCDSAFSLAYDTLETGFKYERDNRAALWKLSPNIKHTLDQIRPEAAQAVLMYSAARNVYKKNPTPTGLSLLQTILAKVQVLSSSVAAAVTTTNH